MYKDTIKEYSGVWCTKCLLPGEKDYPIYYTAFQYKEGGIKNSCSLYKMYKDDPGISKVRGELFDWLDKKDVELIGDIVCKYVEHETWCLSWFNHYTYNSFLSDLELRSSFLSFINRKSRIKDACLMGAEDIWRWKGPCRCNKCKGRGVVYIDH